MERNKIIGLAVGVLLLGGIGFKVYTTIHPEALPAVTESSSTTTSTSSKSESAPTITPSRQAPAIEEPQRPVNGTLKGVVEVGASGFNAFVVNMDADKNWEMVSKQFGESLAYEGFATTDDVKSQLRKYIASISEKGVAGRNTHFVISSGALKNPKIGLIASAIEKMGYTVNRVTADQEGKYALKASMPKAYRDNSFSVDMGSGNTKISWYEGNALKTVEGVGAKYYQNEPKVTDDQAYAQLKELASKVPADKRSRCFVIGGIPYKMAEQVRASENDRYTALAPVDDYSAGDNVKMKSGVNIYRAIIDGTGTTDYYFDWDANFTIGLLMSLN